MDSAGKKYFLNKYQQIGGTITDIQIKPTIRVNTLVTTAKELIERLEKQGVQLQKIPYTKNGYTIIKSKFSLGATTEYLLGHYYMQEAAAQIPVEILDPKPTDTILDACAAPGGKTTQIAAHMKNQGTIIAYELKPHRITSLLMNLDRCRITNTTVFQENVVLAKKLNIQYDKILIDAPCAGNYLSEPGWFEKRTPEGIQTSSNIQKQILKDTISMLKQGGTLVYSTCSLEPEENELNIHWALENLPVKLEPINIPIGDNGITNYQGKQLNPDITLTKRFWPHKTNTEGFFIAKLVRI